MKQHLKYSRRNLLKALGVGAALLPLIEADPADAACLVSGIKRLFVLVWPDGMVTSVSPWAGAGETLAAWQLPSFQASLQPFKSDLLLLNGLDYQFLVDGPASERVGHAAYPGMLTGARYQTAGGSTAGDIAGGPSIDQYIGSQLRAAGYAGLTSLNLGAFVQSTARLSWRGAGQAVIPDLDPYHVYSTYFAGVVAAEGTAASQLLLKRSILDLVGSDLNRFMRVVGSEDKRTIESHLDSVRNLEKRLDAARMSPATADCSVPAAVGPSGTRVNPRSTDEIQTVARLHLDLSVAAFGADLTRTIVMQIGDQRASYLIVKEAGFVAGGPNPGNANVGDVNALLAVAHRNGAEKVRYDTWFQEQVAYMLGRLKSVTDAAGKSLLDSSAFVAMTNMRTGLGEYHRVPAILAGNCGGYFKTGRSLLLPSTPNNQLLVALCNAMGTPVTTFGEASYGGELAGLRP